MLELDVVLNVYLVFAMDNIALYLLGFPEFINIGRWSYGLIGESISPRCWVRIGRNALSYSCTVFLQIFEYQVNLNLLKL